MASDEPSKQSLAGDASNSTITSGTYYDELGRPVVQFRPIEGSGVGGYITNLYQPGWSPGNTLNSSSSVYTYYHSSTFPNYSTDAVYAYANKTYDADPLNRVYQTGGAGTDFRVGGGHETTYSYGVNTSSSDTFTGYGVHTLTKTTVNDPNHHKTITYKDGFGQTIATVVDMDGNGVKSSGDLTTQFTYDALGNLTKSTDPKNLATTYSYDARGQLTSKDMPDQDYSTDYKYDVSGNLRFVRDANHKSNGGFIYYKYDALGNVTEVGQYNGSSSNFTNSTYINDDSWPTSSNQPYIQYYYGPGNAYSGTYSPQGQLVKLSYMPFNSAEAYYFWYTYDPHGNLTSVYSNSVDDPTTWTRDASYTYFPDGQVRELDLGENAQKVDYAYNVQGWLKQINNPSSLTSGNSGYADDRFAQNLFYSNGITPQYNGNISQVNWKLAPSLTSSSDAPAYYFNYDNDNRLASADYGNSGSGDDNSDGLDVRPITYDPNGNIAGLYRYGNGGGATHYVFTDSIGTNKLIQVSVNGATKHLNYDHNGNTTKSDLRGITSATYDWRNLPEQFTLSNGKTLSFVYDADGNRIEKSLSGGGTTTFYINGSDGQAVATYDSEGNAIYINILAGGKIIGRIQRQ